MPKTLQDLQPVNEASNAIPYEENNKVAFGDSETFGDSVARGFENLKDFFENLGETNMGNGVKAFSDGVRSFVEKTQAQNAAGDAGLEDDGNLVEIDDYETPGAYTPDEALAKIAEARAAGMDPERDAQLAEQAETIRGMMGDNDFTDDSELVEIEDYETPGTYTVEEALEHIVEARAAGMDPKRDAQLAEQEATIRGMAVEPGSMYFDTNELTEIDDYDTPGGMSLEEALAGAKGAMESVTDAAQRGLYSNQVSILEARARIENRISDTAREGLDSSDVAALKARMQAKSGNKVEIENRIRDTAHDGLDSSDVATLKARMQAKSGNKVEIENRIRDTARDGLDSSDVATLKARMQAKSGNKVETIDILDYQKPLSEPKSGSKVLAQPESKTISKPVDDFKQENGRTLEDIRKDKTPKALPETHIPGVKKLPEIKKDPVLKDSPVKDGTKPVVVAAIKETPVAKQVTRALPDLSSLKMGGHPSRAIERE